MFSREATCMMMCMEEAHLIEPDEQELTPGCHQYHIHKWHPASAQNQPCMPPSSPQCNSSSSNGWYTAFHKMPIALHCTPHEWHCTLLRMSGNFATRGHTGDAQRFRPRGMLGPDARAARQLKHMQPTGPMRDKEGR